MNFHDPQILYDQLMELVRRRFVHVRFNQDRTLVMFKYTREVFFKNLWHRSGALLEARGIVFTNPDTTGRCEIATLPFKKVFNLGENGVELQPHTWYNLFRKINGFMASVSRNPLTGEVLVTTTGSFDSPYVEMAREMLEADAAGRKHFPFEDETWLYEIVHPNDPHIVEEKIGAHFLASRRHSDGKLFPNSDLFLGSFRGERILQIAENDQTEGYMIYNADGFAAKYKTRYYRTKKLLMRVKGDKLRLIWSNIDKAKLAFSDEEFWPTFHKLRDSITADEFIALGEQERRAFLEAL